MTPSTVSVPRPTPAVLRCRNLEIRPGPMQALAGGRPFELTAREFQLLVALVERRNCVVARDELYRTVWERPMAYRDRSVDVFVCKLRLKLELASPGWVFIHTHIGIGYRFAPERTAIAPERPAIALERPAIALERTAITPERTAIN